MGLMRAVETFDLNRGVEFSTYAMPWVKQKIQRWYEDNRSAVRVPVYMQQVQRLYHSLKSENEDADDEFFVRVIGKLKGISPEGVLWAIKMSNSSIVCSIHQKNSDGSEFDLSDLVAESPEISENVNFEKLFEVLTYREKFILMKRAENWTLEEIALELGITRERIRQVQENALRKVKACVRMRNKQHLFKGENNKWKH